MVYKIDRLTRSTKDLIELIDFFNENECSFNSLTESIDTRSSTGRMFIKIIGIFAEFERENIVERVKFGLERKVKEGYTIANKNISYGYVDSIVQGRKNDLNYTLKYYYNMISFKVNKTYSYIINNIPIATNRPYLFFSVFITIT